MILRELKFIARLRVTQNIDILRADSRKKMPGVVFLIVVPTANFEQDILNGKNPDVKIVFIYLFLWTVENCALRQVRLDLKRVQ